MVACLFIRTREAQDLDALSKTISTLLRVEINEIRHSENAPGGTYVKGEALGLRITLSEADDSDFYDYDFEICFRPQIAVAGRDCLDGLAEIVARHLARHGMKVARPLEFGKAGTPRVEYGDNGS